MRPNKRVRAFRLIALLTSTFLLQPALTAFGAVEEKPAVAAAPQASSGDIKVPQGTLDAVTAIMTRRSIRDYSPRPVPEDLIRLLVEAGMAAPSAFNERSQEFIVIDDRKVLDAIFNLNTKALQIKRASVAIMICGNQEREKFQGKGYWQLDGAVAAENILVAAHAVGLGAVWTAIYPYPDRMDGVKKLLNLPEQVMPLTIIPIGYPAEQKPRENRFEPSRLHKNKWGNAMK
ncbi:MAG: nitroreductase family protein [Desulfobaccales bacterium]